MVHRTLVLALIAGLGLGVSLGLPLYAAEPFPEFTFKRVKPPAPDAKRRITIQITDSALPPAGEDPKPAEAALPDSFVWFWEGVSAARSAAGPGRLQAAIDQLGRAPPGTAFAVPSLEVLSRIANDHAATILLATVGKRVSPALVLAVIAVESGGRTAAQSSSGAQGLMQLMPATAIRFDVDDTTDPAQNIAGGAAYLDFLLNRFDRDPILALAGYNAGENAVDAAGGVPDFAETRAYVPKVIAAFAVARGLCVTPPELVSDGCVFFQQAAK